MNTVSTADVDADVTPHELDPDIEVDALVEATPGQTVEVLLAQPGSRIGLLHRLPLIAWAIADGEIVPVVPDATGQSMALTRQLVLHRIEDEVHSYSHPDMWADLDVDGTWTWRIVQGGAS